LLERIKSFNGDTPLTAGALGEHLELEVPQRVHQMTNGREKQTPRYLGINRVNLQLKYDSSRTALPPSKPAPPLMPLTPSPFNFADYDKNLNQAISTQQAWADYLGQEVNMTNMLGMQFRLLPPGEFMMGSSETKADLERMGISTFEGFNTDVEQPRHRVQISKPMYVGTYEVTLGQFLQYYNADKVNHKTDAEKDGLGGRGWAVRQIAIREYF